MLNRHAVGGKTVYGARVGILMLDTKWPRTLGDTGNAGTWPFPVLYKVVKKATANIVVNHRSEGLRQSFLDAAAELVKEGADGITTTGGFCTVFQDDLAAHTGVPVAASSLLQIPLAQRMLPRGKRVGVLTVQGQRLGQDHLRDVGAPLDTPIVGTEGGKEFTRVLLGDEMEMDYALAEQDILEAGTKLMKNHDNIGAMVLECHNMAPYAAMLANVFQVPIYDVYTLVTWFHSGLAPRDFGVPGGSRHPAGWRER